MQTKEEILKHYKNELSECDGLGWCFCAGMFQTVVTPNELRVIADELDRRNINDRTGDVQTTSNES